MLHKMSACQRAVCEQHPNEAGVVTVGGPGVEAITKGHFAIATGWQHVCVHVCACVCVCMCVRERGNSQ